MAKAYTFFGLLVVQALPILSFAQKEVPPLYVDRGKLMYVNDSLGNRVPDFSYCGYKSSEEAIPLIPVKIVVPLLQEDATERIQSAIDYVSKLQPDKNGFRGTVQLLQGIYKVSGQLTLHHSGVVIRGHGVGENGTIILGTGTTRATLIRITGKNNRKLDTPIKIADAYVPVNAKTFKVANASSFRIGDPVIIHRPSTQAWIKTLGTDHFGGGITATGWKPGERDLYFDRKIVSVENNTVTIDAPITTALDTTYGGATIVKYIWSERIHNVGIENLQLVSTYDASNPKDENHRWDALSFENSTDGWVRQVSFRHFAGSAVRVLETASRITVEDCLSLDPVSEIGGQRRYTFFTTGQQILFQRCYAQDGYHDFAVGYCSPGPNAFVQCTSVLPFQFSGAIESWSSGILFDLVNIDGNALRYGNRGQDANGAGWAAANSVFWNCSASRMDCYKPPTAQNWSFGSWSQFTGDGYWGESNNTLTPASLFYAQLKERLQKEVSQQAQILELPTEASSSPSVATAIALTKETSKPRMQLKEWIEQAADRNKLTTDVTGVPTIDKIPTVVPVKITPVAPLEVKQGVLVRGNQLITGRRQGVQWWSGGIQAKELQQARPHITRYVPGRTGNGLTDDLEEVATEMQAKGIIAMEHNYGLWYDRRRDDHERVRRMDGEVWPPFYELPFARSGKETAWDGLSKYDLTKFNPFYWERLKQFAQLAEEKGLVLVHQNYFQHNIIEAGAHFADFPWRTANNINNTGFTEPVNYAGDKRIFYAEQFYDTTHPVRRELHKKYIRQCLDNFKENNSVIHTISEEYTGPLHFVKFWLDVIRAWKNETGKKPLIALSVTKDVQDSILALPGYAALIDVIDIRYWHYQADGTVYAPAGGQNLAPRQHARLLKPKKTSFEQVYKAVLAYRNSFPDKAVIYSGDNYPEFGMAAFMAGGSLPVLPQNIDKSLAGDAAGMKPVPSSKQDEYILSNGRQKIVYNRKSGKLERR